VDPVEVNAQLKPHTRDIVRWAIHGGRRAIFAAFGLHKTATQIEIMRLIGKRRPDMFRLIVLPLGVRQEFKRDAAIHFQGDYAIKLKFIRTIAEAEGPETIYLTNYESVREGVLDVSSFGAVSLDEAAVLADRGSKTFGEFVFNLFDKTEFKFVATATPSPNEYQELIGYAAFLGISDISRSRTRFFKRNSTKADALTLYPGKEKEFFHWLSTWAVFLQSPADLGYSTEGYDLPELEVVWHEIPTSHANAGQERTGQAKLLKTSAIGVVDAAREKRESLAARIAKIMELRELDPGAHRIIWHDLEAERHAIEKALSDYYFPRCGDPWATVYGSQELEKREQAIIDFSDGKIRELAGKPSMLGSGCNFQRHCAWAIFAGIGFKFRDFIQAIHRLHRFQQTKRVRIDLIYTEAERRVRDELQRKWDEHKKLMEQMSALIREHGLAVNALQESGRATGVDRKEARGEKWLLANNDAVLEYRDHRESNSSGLILTSLPFGNQYEYSLNYSDFGHTDSAEHFWQQMGYLIPELYRVLKPGRDCVIHCKDRIVDGGMTGLGFQTVYSFLSDVIRNFQRHGFAFLGHQTIVTDVVRENAATYRLGYTEQCKDGTRMGFGLAEYLCVFRKPPTDCSNGYADEQVVKAKAEYSRSRWQIDAHGFARSNGNRLLPSDELRKLPWGAIYRLFRSHSISHVYDHEQHVEASEGLEAAGRLPVDFMLLPPQSWHPDVWTDVMRARTLNGAQSAKGREKHICPLQLDIVDRVIRQRSAPGDIVDDPFSGIGTVPARAVALGRLGRGSELSTLYWQDSLYYCDAAEKAASTPTLFEMAPESEETSGCVCVDDMEAR
jgi:DNA modification methylase